MWPTGGRVKAQCRRRRHRQADRELDQGEPGDAAEIEIDLERLEDRHFERRAARSAAERQNDGEALEAHQEDEAGDAGQFRAQDRPVEMAEDLGGREAEGGGEAPVLGRHLVQAVERDPRDEGSVQEHVGDEDAGIAEDAEALRPPEKRQRLGKPSAAAVDGEDGEDGDDGRHHHRRSKDGQNDVATGKSAAGEREREADAEQQGTAWSRERPG